MEFAETIIWTAKNKAQFSVTDVGNGTFLLCGSVGRVSSEYPFKDQEDFLPAFWTVAYALECGTKFHMKHGFIPQVKDQNGKLT